MSSSDSRSVVYKTIYIRLDKLTILQLEWIVSASECLQKVPVDADFNALHKDGSKTTMSRGAATEAGSSPLGAPVSRYHSLSKKWTGDGDG